MFPKYSPSLLIGFAVLFRVRRANIDAVVRAAGGTVNGKVADSDHMNYVTHVVVCMTDHENGNSATPLGE